MRQEGRSKEAGLLGKKVDVLAVGDLKTIPEVSELSDLQIQNPEPAPESGSLDNPETKAQSLCPDNQWKACRFVRP